MHKKQKCKKRTKCKKNTKCTDSLENAAGCTVHDDLPDTTHRLTSLPPSRKGGTICFLCDDKLGMGKAGMVMIAREGD